MFNRVAILGMGLIGGSIGLSLQQTKAVLEVVGYDVNKEACRRASEIGAIDAVALSPSEAVRDADLIILATPVGAMRNLLVEIASSLASDALITDVASTKAQVVTWAQEILPSTVTFIGGHPMTGKESSGVEVADEHLFHDCIYCLTPTQLTPQSALSKVVGFVEILGAHIHYIEPVEHDRQVAIVSHLPFIASTALMANAVQDTCWSEAAMLAAGGFKDMSRLAAGSPEMYRDICITNANAIVTQIDLYISTLRSIRESIRSHDEYLVKIFAAAQEQRLLWLAKRNFPEA